MKKLLLLTCGIFLLIGCGKTEVVQQKTTQEQKTILALGDSVTAGYGVDLSENYPSQLQSLIQSNNYNYEIINAGVSGETSKNLLDRIKLYDDMDPDLIILTIGGNDGLRRQSIDDMKENIQAIIDHLQQQHTQTPIIFAGMELPINYGLSYSRNFKNAYEEIAQNNELYFYEFFLDGVAKDVKLNLNDGIHPNPAGYTVISNNLYDFLTDNNLLY